MSPTRRLELFPLNQLASADNNAVHRLQSTVEFPWSIPLIKEHVTERADRQLAPILTIGSKTDNEYGADIYISSQHTRRPRLASADNKSDKDKKAQAKSTQGDQKSGTGDQGSSGKKLSDY